EPAVDHVHWVALGDDGHTVSGDFAFGVSEANGAPPPGAAAGLGGGGTAGRGGSAGGQSPVSIALLWLGILAASVLWAGQLLILVLARRRVAGAGRAAVELDRLGRVALVAAAASVLYGVLEQAG